MEKIISEIKDLKDQIDCIENCFDIQNNEEIALKDCLVLSLELEKNVKKLVKNIKKKMV